MRTRVKTPGNNDRTRDMHTGSIRALDGPGQDRTFRVSFSSEARVEEYDGIEILDHRDGAVDLTRLNEIGVLLFNHDRDKVIGRIERAWLENGRGEAEVVFDEDPFSAEIYEKVRSGTLRTTSVGYRVNNWETVREGARSADGRFEGPCLVATRWAPFEISIVSVPADETVGVGRSYREPPDTAKQIGGREKMTLDEMLARQRALIETARIENRAPTDDEYRELDELAGKIRDMSARATEPKKDEEEEADVGASTDEEEKPKKRDLDPALAAQRAIAAERSRVREIQALGSEWDIDVRSYVDNGSSIAEACAGVLRELQRDRGPIRAGLVQVRTDEADKFRDAASDALCLRAGVRIDKPVAGASELRHMSLKDIAVRCLAYDGVAPLQSLMSADPRSVFELCMRSWTPAVNTRAFMQPAGQFPVFLDNSIEKSLVEWYKHPDYEFEKICKIGSLPDFNPHDDNYMSGPVGDFEELPEAGEMKEDTFEFVKLGQRKLQTYGKRFSLSFQAFVNDDIGLIAEMPRKMERAWRRTLNNLVFGILVGNTVMQDGAKLFSAAHHNLIATGETITGDALTAMTDALSAQTDQSGEVIQITPRTLIIPTGLDLSAYTLFHSPTIQTTSNTQAANPWFDPGYETIKDHTINILAERLNLATVPWFLAGDAMAAPGIEIDYLNGESRLQRRMGQPMDQLGFVWNFWGFAGVTAIDYRRYVMNPGIAIDPRAKLAK